MSSDSEMYTPKKDDSLRKINKPMMEKKRRARINHCLTQLKSLVLEAMKRDSAQISKLEKADILEMTVNYLRNTQHQQQQCVDSTTDMRRNKYRTGFNECATEVMRYLGNEEGATPDVKSRLSDHLTRCVRVMNSRLTESRTEGNEYNSRTYGEGLSIDIPVSGSNMGSIPNQNSVYLLKTQNANATMSYRGQQSVYTTGQMTFSESLSHYQINKDNSMMNVSPVRQGQGNNVTSGQQHIQHPGYLNGSMNSGRSTPTGNDNMDQLNNNNEAVWRPW
ncbi:protein hairy-like isoform X2 [Mizuhopecten yessoensis]|uniref:protein hairy-like isoform X2 n=1 Tax=Mizuhopecten yessoensis TaxID=6573 RepID=UPI000B45B7D0|nr:protein hairy-like isoform X2 [Mizuhopecten yessoensis]